MILFLYTMTAKDEQLNKDFPPMWYTNNSGDLLTLVSAPSKNELDLMLSILSRKIADKKSWGNTNPLLSNITDLVRPQMAKLLEELREEAKQKTVNETADLLKASLANTSKLKSIKKRLLDDHPYSSSQKRKADTAELLKGAEDFLDRCKRLKAQVEAEEE